MIFRNFKFAFLSAMVLALFILGLVIRNYIITYKDEAVSQALAKVEAIDNEIRLRQQSRIIQKQNEAFSKTKDLQTRSSLVSSKIKNSQSTSENINIQSDIIEEINCRIDNFLKYDLCQKY